MTAATQICLEINAGPAAGERLAAALGAAPIASVVIRAPQGRPLDVGAARALVQLAQAKGAAALIAGDAAAARAAGADGVHLDASEDAPARFAEARRALGPGAIVGAEAGPMRHDAMELGEAGADYVAFGPRAEAPAVASDAEAAGDWQIAHVAWWAEIFAVPCVALGVRDAERAAAIAAGNAEFLSIPLPEGASVAAVRALVQSIAAAVGEDAHAART